MQRFAALLDDLTYHDQRNGKLRLIADYLRTTPDPDRGWALAALTDGLDMPHAQPALIRSLAAERLDPVLFALSYDYVGDLAETVALLWPVAGPGHPPPLGELIATLGRTGKAAMPGVVAGLLDQLDTTGRWALLKLLTGTLRVGVSGRLARLAVAQFGAVDPAAIEDLWPSATAPFTALLAWVEGRGPRPANPGGSAFRPVMLAHALDEATRATLVPGDFCAEWKWDGIRVQAAVSGPARRLYSRNGEDLSAAFPDLVGALDFEGVVDGELLVLAGPAVAPFADLQKRLNRKTPGAKLMRERPARLRAYDLLFDGPEDLRPLPFSHRRQRLEAMIGSGRPGLDLSPLIAFADWDDLARRRADTTGTAIEGVMLKRRDSPYLAGRPRGLWWKWKRDPHLVDAVLMYAQRGHGKRSSDYADFTFGVWADGDRLVPVGKACLGFTDAALEHLDRWVRGHLVKRYGPVAEVSAGLVLEIAFEGLQHSTRHRSGIALRFPRIHRIRWDKPAAEADRLDALLALLG